MKKWQEERNYRRVRNEGGEVIANTLLVRRSKNLDFPVFSKVSLSNVSFQSPSL